MRPILYYMDVSPPSRAVALVAKVLGVDLEIKNIDLTKKQQIEPEFTKINPQHTIPTLNDNGFILWESNAIAKYLCQHHGKGKGEYLYPTDVRVQATIDQRLHFNSGVLFPTLRRLVIPVLYEGAKSYPADLIGQVNDIYGFLESFLDGRKWVAWNKMTIADIVMMPTLMTMNVIHPIGARFPRVRAWMELCQEEILDFEIINGPGLKKISQKLKI